MDKETNAAMVTKGDNIIKKCVPLIETNKEKASFVNLNSHKSQLKNEELFYRVMER